MNTLTLVTICYNSARTIQRTVDSVLRQRRLPQQYLFVDGGSTDGTLELLDGLRHQLQAKGVLTDLIHQVRQPHMAGIPHAWNLGIGAASGDVVALLNSDDWYEDDALRQFMDAFEANPAILAVSAPIYMRNPDGSLAYLLPSRSLRLLPILMPIPHPGCFFRRLLYEQIGGYDPEYSISADYDFIWRCHRLNLKFHRLPRPLVNMEIGGKANANRALAREETYRIAKKYAPHSPLPGLARLLRRMTDR